MDDDFANWFSGFVDGEGCFTYNSYERYTTPQFTIHLRADDREILEECQRRFGGCISEYEVTERAKKLKPGCSPDVLWQVTANKELLGIVRHFEKYPLRAKKKCDFEIWKLMVQEKAKPHPDENYVIRLRKILSVAKKYKSITSMPKRRNIQLRIEW